MEVAIVTPSGETYLAYNGNTVKPQFTAPPLWLPFTNLQMAHHFARQPNNFSFSLEVGSLPSHSHHG